MLFQWMNFLNKLKYLLIYVSLPNRGREGWYLTHCGVYFQVIWPIDLGTRNYRCLCQREGYRRFWALCSRRPRDSRGEKRILAVAVRPKRCWSNPGNIFAIRPMKDGVIAILKSRVKCFVISSLRSITVRLCFDPGSSSPSLWYYTRWKKGRSGIGPIGWRKRDLPHWRADGWSHWGWVPITEASGNMIVILEEGHWGGCHLPIWDRDQWIHPGGWG